jgi:hypothetical protein
MSTMTVSTVTMELRPFERAQDVPHLHPRGRGFRVLSRIARGHTADADYSPRHRRDVPADLVRLESSLAS